MQKEGASLTPHIFVEPGLVPGCVVDTRIMTVETERDVDPGLQRRSTRGVSQLVFMASL